MIEIIKCALVAEWFAKQNMFSIIKPSWLKTDSLFWSSSKRMHMANNDWRCKLQITNDSEFHPLVNYWRKKDDGKLLKMQITKNVYDSEFHLV